MRRRLAAIVAIAALAGGCAGGNGGGGPEVLSIYVSAPLSGGRAADGAAVADGAKLAMADARGRVGELRVRAIYLDDTEDGGWSLARTAANARRASEDASSIGYIGDLDSGATRVSLPITNQAQIMQISPGSTAVDLTRLPPVGDLGPEQLQPSGEQNFARVVPDDEVQGGAAAEWAKRLGGKRVGVIDDGSQFGGVLSRSFEQRAARLGLGSGEGSGADLVYYAGEPDRFATALRGLPPRPVIGSDALINPAFLRSVAPLTERLYLTSSFLAPSLLPPEGRRFARAYRQRFGHPAAPAAAYGYEAMALLLDAIRRAGENGDARAAVIDEVLSTRDRSSVLGTYSIDGNGDTTLDAVSGYRISDGLPVFPVKLVAPR